MAQDIEIKIDELVLDKENPRIESEAGQINIRQAVIDDQGSKIVELATDIVAYGLNPMDRLMVLKPNKTKKEYVALEGNRRTAALQLLANPELMNDLAVTDSFRSKIFDLSDTFDVASVEPIKCVLVADRESARRWIELRHTGENNGKGIVDWNGVQTARFRGDKTFALLEFVKLHGDFADSEISDVKTFPITTLDRLVSNPAVRQKLGLQIVDGKFFTEYAGESIIPALKRIILDLGQKKINVTSLKTSEQQKTYVSALPANLLPSGKKLSTPLEVSKSIKTTIKLPPPKSVPPPPPPSPLSRKTLIPTEFSTTVQNQKAAQIIYELRMINIEKFPVAGAMLLRGLIEAAVGVYGTKHTLDTHHKSGKNLGKPLTLTEKLSNTLAHLGKMRGLTKQQQTAATNALVDKKSVISISRLHEFVHNPAAFPTKNDLIASWSSAEPFIVEALK